MSSDNDESASRRDLPDPDLGSPSMQEALRELAAARLGLGFIYSALELLATRYELQDAVIVLTDEAVGTQIFRLNSGTVSVDLAVRLGSTPGLYCAPDVVSFHDREVVLLACQQALSLQQSRLVAAQETPTGTDDRTFEEDGARVVTDRGVLTSTSAMAAKRLLVGLHPLAKRNSRATISMVLVFVDVVTLLLTIEGVHGPLRFLFGLALGVIVPGWSVVGLLKLKNAALEVGLTMATSLALIMIAAQIMMTMSLWHPVAFEELSCLVCLPSLLWQARSLDRRSSHS